ncbi:MAG: DUF3010 family protein [Campylobacterota bacterium]|nr:DUF3010 family protein [Campylobacterota bacterium]
MIICGIELKANNALIALINSENNNIEYIEHKQKKISIEDDENMEHILKFSNHIKELITTYNIEKIAIKKRAKKGNFAGGAVTFKLEAIIQLNGISPVEFVSSQALNKLQKKDEIKFPSKLNKYQEQAYLAAVFCSS